MRLFSRSGFISLLAHGLLLGVAFTFAPKLKNPPATIARLDIEVTGAGGRSSRPLRRQSGHGTVARRAKIDLRPAFARDLPAFVASPPGSGPAARTAGSESFSGELLNSESKVVDIFDSLAARIDSAMIFPQLLIDRGFSGFAIMDLYFDSEGRLDEARTALSGDCANARGILTIAARKGLVAWFTNDALRLSREQFRNQHFRATFISASMGDTYSEVRKDSVDNYSYTRRQYVPQFEASHLLGGLSHQLFSSRKTLDKEDGQYLALTDRLEYYDQMGLAGVNDDIREILELRAKSHPGG